MTRIFVGRAGIVPVNDLVEEECQEACRRADVVLLEAGCGLFYLIKDGDELRSGEIRRTAVVTGHQVVKRAVALRSEV